MPISSSLVALRLFVPSAARGLGKAHAYFAALVFCACSGSGFEPSDGTRPSERLANEAEAEDLTEEAAPARYRVMTEELNAALLGCPEACERMAASGCEGFRSLAGCYEVCPSVVGPDYCAPLLREYFTCLKSATFSCNEDGKPKSDACDAEEEATYSCVNATSP